MPYFASVAAEVTELGWPMMRPMVLEYPDDPACRYLDRQYLLGESLLVAPVFSEDSTVEYYLPPGNWTSFWTGETAEGGRWYKETVGFMEIPLFVRENTLLPLGSNESTPDYDYQEELTLHIFGLADGAAATAHVPGRAGKPAATVTARRDGGVVTLTSNMPLPSAQVQMGRGGEITAWSNTRKPLRVGLAD
jgi:alpha-D-xyloside xylohydrolase